MEDIPFWIKGLFVLTTIITISLFWLAAKKKIKALYLILIWMLIQTVLGLSQFYFNFEANPPRFLFLLFPGLLFSIILLFTKGGKRFIHTLDLKWLTLLHTVRIPVEIVLYYVFLAGLVPVEMTFEGRNFDILSGLTAPVIYVMAFRGKTVKRYTLLVWNVLSLALLVNVLIIAILSAKTPFQQMAFEQPNIGVTYFPFVWLPSIIVPIVFFSILASLLKLYKNDYNAL